MCTKQIKLIVRHALTTSLRRLQQQSDENDESVTKKTLFRLLFGSHPPTDQRTFGLVWESNVLKMQPENSFMSAAFDGMKQRVKEINKED